MAKRILVVDDSPSIRNVARTALERGGYEVVEAGDGKEALTALKVNASRPFSMVLCDVNMPVMDGLTFCAAMQEWPTFRAIPVVMCTTEASDAVKAKGKAAGAKGWMVKPFQPPQLLEVVSRLAG